MYIGMKIGFIFDGKNNLFLDEFNLLLYTIFEKIIIFNLILFLFISNFLVY